MKFWLLALALVAAWGGWQRWQAIGAKTAFKEAQLEAQAANARQAAADATEHARRLKQQQEKIDAANEQAKERQKDAAHARAALGQLREHTAAIEANSRRTNPPTASECEAAVATGGVLAHMLDQLATRAAAYAEYAEAAAAAGKTCEALYDDLTSERKGK